MIFSPNLIQSEQMFKDSLSVDATAVPHQIQHLYRLTWQTNMPTFFEPTILNNVVIMKIILSCEEIWKTSVIERI